MERYADENELGFSKKSGQVRQDPDPNIVFPACNRVGLVCVLCLPPVHFTYLSCADKILAC